jgi:hypothetical protein
MIMKKILPLVILCLILVSCKKTWQCECKEVFNWQDWEPTVTNVAIENKKENDAKVICKSFGFDFGSGNYKTCELK